MNHLVKGTSGERVSRPTWPLVDTGIAETDDADDVSVVGDVELLPE
jgi:hypothetical protein